MKDASYHQHDHHGHSHESYKVSTKITKTDVLIMLVLFTLSCAVKFPTINYPLSGDASVYAELTKNLYQHQSYAINGVFHTVYPFLFPMLSVPLMLFTDNVIALKLASFFWSSLAVVLLYLLARRLSFDKKLATITALLLLFNPWFFYFTATFPLSESLATVLIMLAYFTYDFDTHYSSSSSKESSQKASLLSALFFAAAILTRYTAAIFLIPIAVVKAIEILNAKNWKNKNGNNNIIKNNFLFLIIAMLPPLLWIVLTFLKTQNFATHSYFGIFVNQNPITISLLINNAIKIIFIAPFLLLLGLILFSFLTLSYFLKYRNMDKEHYFTKSTIWHYVLASYLLNLVIAIIWFSLYPKNFVHIWEQLRFFVPFLPFMILFSMLSANIVYKKYKMALNKVFTIIFSAILIISIIATFYVNYGFVKDNADRMFQVREFFVQKAYHQEQAIDFINDQLENKEDENMQTDDMVIILLSQQTIRDRQDIQFKNYFESNNLYDLNQSPNPQFVFPSGVNQVYREYYIYSEFNQEETELALKNKNIQFSALNQLKTYGRTSKITIFQLIQ